MADFTGTPGPDTMSGTSGPDRLEGGAGDDVYHVDDAGDLVIEAAGGGSDTVLTRVSYRLSPGQEIELLTTWGSSVALGVDLTGNAFAQTIVGDDGANRLDGKGGADLMWGYAGDDIYYVDHAGDRVGGEAAGGGSDWVITNVSYALAAGQEIELLTTYGSSIALGVDLTGNAFAQTLVGDDGANRLDGKGGADTMWGYGGGDIYVVDHAGDRVVEAAFGGSDTVWANVSYTLAAGQEIETLTTWGTASTHAIDLAGNEYANTIVGNDGANRLDGKRGADTLWGYGGADTFAFTTALGGGNVDRIADFAAGTDRIALDDAVFAGLAPGALPAGAFRAGTSAQDADDRILYDSATGALFFDPDGAGGAAAVQFATLTPGLPLAASDFVVI